MRSEQPMKKGQRLVAELVAVGDELLAGHVANSNAQFLAQTLRAVGVVTQWMTTVGDQRQQMLEALRQALGRAQVVVVTGGLGPTPDDLTREVIAELLGVPLLLDEQTLVALRARFAARGLPMSANNERQAQIPQGATILRNPLGTAPGFMFSWEGCQAFVLPGVPAAPGRRMVRGGARATHHGHPRVGACRTTERAGQRGGSDPCLPGGQRWRGP